MNVIFALLAGLTIGGLGAAWWIKRRFHHRLEQAKQDVNDITKKHNEVNTKNKELKQKVADLQFQLNQANNELRSLRS